MTCKFETDCRCYTSVASPDAISGLTPMFKSSTPLPEGAVLVSTAGFYDWYWVPNGSIVAVSDTAYHSDTSRLMLQECALDDACTLDLPLAGEDLREGEEFWTDRRLDKLVLERHGPGVRRKTSGFNEGASCMTCGLVFVRRWERGAVRGWICRRIEQKPAPDPHDLGEWPTER